MKPTREQAIEALLRERALRVAGRMDAEAQTEGFILFRRASTIFGVSYRDARACWPASALFEVPGAPRWIAGAASSRGWIVSVVDLAALYELPRAGASDLRSVLVVEVPGGRLGIACEALLGAREVPVHAIGSSAHPRGALARSAVHGSQRIELVDCALLAADPRLNPARGGTR